MQRAVLERDAWRCWICKADDPPADSADHVVARKHGGLTVMANLRAAHARCNSSKGARTVLPDARVAARWR